MQQGRVIIIDILRGFAVLGIILVNFHEMNFLPGTEGFFEAGVLAKLIKLFFFNRAYLIFAFLFGYSLYIFKRSTLKHGKQISNRIIYQRLLAILILGLIQTIVLWWGTILILYSIYGFIIFLIVKRIPFVVKIIAALTILIIVPILISYLNLKIPPTSGLNINFLPQLDLNQLHLHYKQGHLLKIMQLNLHAWLYDYFNITGGVIKINSVLSAISYNCQILGLILLGYTLSEKYTIQNITRNTNLLLLTLFLSIYLFVRYANKSLLALDLIFIENLFFTFSLILLIMFISKTKFAFLIRPFSIVGKAAFSFYVLHMLFSYIIFHVLGQYQQFSFIQVELFAFGTFCLLFIIMYWCVHKTQYGLFEIILRKLTYLRVPIN